MERITSLANDKVKYWCKLSKKKFRDEEGLFLVEGEHLVNEAIELKIVKEIITSDDSISYNGLVTLVSEDVLKKISNLESAPKVMAVVKIDKAREIEGNVLLLDRIQDPGNLGTMIRSAVAFNIKTIVLGKGTVDAYNSKTIRASEGMIFKVNILEDNLENMISLLHSKDYVVMGTKVTDGVDIGTLDKPSKYALLIGNEGQGTSNDLLELCDTNLYIKMSNACESLNAAVAASILMYEINK